MYVKNDKNFVIVPDLKQTFKNQFTTNVGKHEVLKMRNTGSITDRDMIIIDFLFNFRFATAYQIQRLLKMPTEKITIRSRLEKLVEYRVLNKFILGNIESMSQQMDALEIYCMDRGGQYILESYTDNDVSDWYPTANFKSSNIISKDIFVSELYVRLMETCPSRILSFKKDPQYRLGKKNIFMSFEFVMDIGGAKRGFVGEVVREHEAMTTFREKIQKIEGLLLTNAWKKYFFDTTIPPVLLLLTDNDLSAFDVGRVTEEATEIQNFRITTDDRIKRELSSIGAFLKYSKEDHCVKELKASTFAKDKQE